MIRRSDSLRKRLVSGMLPVLGALPARLAGRALGQIGALELAWNLPWRAQIHGLMARFIDRLQCDCPAAAASQGWAAKTLRWHARDYLLERLDGAAFDASVAVAGRANLDQAIARKKGVVLLFNHFGPFLIHSHWLVRHGYGLRWFTERPRRISRLVAKTFDTDGPLGQKGLFLTRKLAPSQAGAMLRRALRILEAGMIVQAAGDVRWNTGRAVPARFLGRNDSFTTSWVSLAACSGAAVVPVFARMNLDGTYGIEFLDPFQVEPEAKEPHVAAPYVQANLDRVEAYIRRDPTDCGDYLFWLSDEAAA